MGLFRRVGDIIAANLNELIDHFEDPETMLRHAVREVEVSIDEAMDGAAKAVASEKLIEKEIALEERETAESERRAGRALRSNDLPLARRILRQKLEREKLLGSLRNELESARRYCEGVRREVEALKIRLTEAKRKLTLLAARKRVAHAWKRLHSRASGLKGQAFARFERMEERIEAAEAEGEALALLNAPEAPRGEEVDPEVERELEALRENEGG